MTKCEICNSMEGPFNIHHIVPLKDFAKWAIHGIDDDDNKITLCHGCHVELHRAYKELKHRLELSLELTPDRYANDCYTQYNVIGDRDFYRIIEKLKRRH